VGRVLMTGCRPGQQQGKSKAPRFKVKRAGRESAPLEKFLHGGRSV
jgi:hypothetical protein